jgi:protein-S-isoprenylcysteine O-methyltransferase Ste14
MSFSFWEDCIILTRRFEHIGRWLFKWRSFLPLVTAGLFLVALRHFTYPRGSHYLDSIWDGVSLGVAFLGLVIRIITVGYVPRGTSGRTTRNPKASVLNTTGMYSIVRHPLYLGNFFIWLGFSMFPRSLFFSLSAILLFFLYYERIIFAEERFLQDLGKARTEVFVENGV